MEHRGWNVPEEDEDDRAHDQHLFLERMHERLDRPFDEVRAVVRRHHLDVRPGAWRELVELLLHALDTFRAFSPWRITMMPPTVSPTHSDPQRRGGIGPSVTFASCFTAPACPFFSSP